MKLSIYKVQLPTEKLLKMILAKNSNKDRNRLLSVPTSQIYKIKKQKNKINNKSKNSSSKQLNSSKKCKNKEKNKKRRSRINSNK